MKSFCLLYEIPLHMYIYLETIKYKYVVFFNLVNQQMKGDKLLPYNFTTHDILTVRNVLLKLINKNSLTKQGLILSTLHILMKFRVSSLISISIILRQKKQFTIPIFERMLQKLYLFYYETLWELKC